MSTPRNRADPAMTLPDGTVVTEAWTLRRAALILRRRRLARKGRRSWFVDALARSLENLALEIELEEAGSFERRW